MKKRILALALAAVMAGSLTACSGSSGTDTKAAPAQTEAPASESKPEESKAEEGDAAKTASSKGGAEGYELALVTDLGTIDDKSFNQGAWEGLKKYAEENSISYKYYQPQEGTTDSYLETIGLAIEGGAKLVVCPGFLFEEPIYMAQDKYPDVHFILLDGEPHDADYNYKTNDNVMPILFQEDQAGFLAGYAAVTEGYTQLGFMGGIAVPAVIRYGYGFIQGADAAAKEMGLEPGSVSVKYTYVGNFDASPENNAKAAAWYNEGTECIFACGGGVGNSVMKAAESAGKVVIGVDVDQSSESATVITSAMKNLGDSVYDAVAGYYDGNFEGGKSVTLDAKENGIMLPMETSKFKVFTQEKYDELYEMLKDGTIQVANDTVATQASAVPTDIVKVDLIK